MKKFFVLFFSLFIFVAVPSSAQLNAPLRGIPPISDTDVRAFFKMFSSHSDSTAVSKEQQSQKKQSVPNAEKQQKKNEPPKADSTDKKEKGNVTPGKKQPETASNETKTFSANKPVGGKMKTDSKGLYRAIWEQIYSQYVGS